MMETISITGIYLRAIITPLLLFVLVIGALVLDMTYFKKRVRTLGIFILIGIVIIFFMQFFVHVYWLNFMQHQSKQAIIKAAITFNKQYYFDIYSAFFNYLFLISAAVSIVLSLTHMEKKDEHRGEYYILLVIATIGACMMAAAHDLIILFIGLEIMSISVYVLVGTERESLRSNEASMKYLLLGAFGSAILLYGMALVYGMAGSMDYQGLSDGIFKVYQEESQAQYLTLIFGVCLILAGMFFKVAAVPFHMWTPDVYEGAPTPITAYMATAVKAAAFAGLLRLMITAFTPLWGLETLYHVLWVVSVLTMTLGNFVAIAQKNLKRMLAYSSIAHAGYLLVAITTIVASGQYLGLMDFEQGFEETIKRVYPAASSILFYLCAYTFMNLGAFGLIVALAHEKKGGETLDDFSGLSIKRPGLAVVMAICMLSLAGIPPLVGFMGKFYIFQSAIRNRLFILAIIGVLNSVVSAYYYLRVVVVMYMEPEKVAFDGDKEKFSGVNVVVMAMAMVVVLMGVFPNKMLTLINTAFLPDMIELIFL